MNSDTQGLTLLLAALGQAEEIVDRYCLHQYVGHTLGELWTQVDEAVNDEEVD
jgi:hypothetical protein